jgi:hypothetical protein
LFLKNKVVDSPDRDPIGPNFIRPPSFWGFFIKINYYK